MKWRDAIVFSAGNLHLSPLRTILTVLGLGVGVGAIWTVMALGNAGEMRVEDEISRLGVDKVWIHAEEPAHPLSNDDSERIASASGAPACAGAYATSVVDLGDDITIAQICGYDTGFEAVHHPTVIQGRLFTAREYRLGSAVALVDTVLAERIDDILGKRLALGSRKFRVIGVIDGLATQTMSGMSGMIVIPLSSFADTWSTPVGEITIGVPRGMQAGALAQIAVETLSRSGGTYRASTLEEEIEAARSVVRIFVMVLACVAAVCMLNGSIGVMNILLVSVRERRREIGLLKAIGASSGQIALLFLLEAAGYALIGGILGLVLGALMIRLCAWWIGLEAVLSAWQALLIMAGAAVIGALFGVLPALRAAALEPVKALRQE